MKNSWIAVMVLVAGTNARAAECNVLVYVRESVPVAAPVSIGARYKAGRMFQEIGVAIRWQSGEVKISDADRSCGPAINVEIGNTPSSCHRGSNVLAYAAPFADSGTCIHIFMDRVQKASEELTTALLAHVLVHEIGHVLERISRHSADGVMKAHWAAPEFRGMIAHALPFAPEDVQLIHRGIEGRLAAGR